MRFLIFLPERLLLLYLSFNESQPIYNYKPDGCKKECLQSNNRTHWSEELHDLIYTKKKDIFFSLASISFYITNF